MCVDNVCGGECVCVWVQEKLIRADVCVCYKKMLPCCVWLCELLCRRRYYVCVCGGGSLIMFVWCGRGDYSLYT